MKGKRFVRRWETHFFSKCLAAALLILCNACLNMSGGSGETGNPELELNLRVPGGQASFTGSLRLYSRDHDPLVDSLPLLVKNLMGANKVSLTLDELSSALEGQDWSGFKHTQGFNCILSNEQYETFVGGFQLIHEKGSRSLIRIEARDTLFQDAAGRLRILSSLDQTVHDLRGAAYDPGLESGLEWVFLKGTPYLAKVREGGFRFERIAPGGYSMMAQTPRGERFASIYPFLTDSAVKVLEWTKENLDYWLSDSGLILKGVDASNPMIYDNDLFATGVDDEYMWAKASLGAPLRGIIATRELSFPPGLDTLSGHYGLTTQQCLDEAIASVARARRSGMRNLPDPIAGAENKLVEPPGRRISDTQAKASPGSDLILREAHVASPEKPLVIFVGGGQVTTVANAYLLDPSIARRIVVIASGLDSGSKDPWATHIVSKRCKLINFGPSSLWWPQKPEPTVFPSTRFIGLPDNEVIRAMDSLARLNEGNSQKLVDPTRDAGFNDGAGLFLVFAPRSWTSMVRLGPGPTGTLWPVEGPMPFDRLEAASCNFGKMTEGFFATFADPAVFRTP